MPSEPLDYESRQPATPVQCPFCASVPVVSGTLAGSESHYIAFSPDNTRRFVFTFIPPAVRLDNAAFACTNCGAVWSHADPAKMREVLALWTKGKNPDAGPPGADPDC